METGSNRRMVQHVAACPPPAPADTLSRGDKNVCAWSSMCVCVHEKQRRGRRRRRKAADTDEHGENQTQRCLGKKIEVNISQGFVRLIRDH